MPEMTSQVASSIKGLTQEFDLIAHNLANVSTPGFKRMYNDFAKTLAAQQTGLDSADSQAQPTTGIDFTQGNFLQTGGALDMALCGKGFFVIETPDGPLYTRSGMFRLNGNCQIVDLSGRVVAGQSGPITIPSTVALSQVNIASDGTVSAPGLQIGKFKLVDFKDNIDKLTPAGLSCFAAPKEIKPDKAENLIVKQGYQESSNVQMVEELVDMIMVSRLYEANMKMLSTGSETSKNLLDVAMS